MAEEDDEIYPLIIYCEGGTTNGTQLVRFKRGAFVACGSIWPKIIRYKSGFISPCSGVIDGLPHYLLCGCCPFTDARRIELPIFRPNDYFWENHVQEGEERWQAYRRVMQEILSFYSGLPISDSSIDEKYEYKKLLYPEKTN